MERNNPKVSIILATYNRSHFLVGAIKSVLEQSYGDWELIISDDASKDDTESIVNEWKEKDARIVYRKNDKNRGISANYNAAINIARGKYIAMLDDDDAWIGSDKLQKQVNFLEQNGDHVGVGGGMVVVDENLTELFRYLKPENDDRIRKSMFFSNPMANSTTLFRKVAAVDVGLYDETIEHGADREFWMRMGKVGKLHNIQEYFSYYTLTGDNAIFVSSRVMFKCVLAYMKKHRRAYPGYSKGKLLYWGAYIYSFLPKKIRSFTNRIVFRKKHSMFDSVHE